MKPRTLTILYWGLTLLFCLLMLADGAAGPAREAHGQATFRQLGYPLYALPIIGAAKVLGALALLLPWYRTLKEWAFAGFTINFPGAALSTACAGLGLAGMAPALVMLAVLFGPYFLWKRYRARDQPLVPVAGSVSYAS